MNKKLLAAALLGGLAMAQAASAQEFDDRWYLTGSAGFNFQDSDRGTNDAPFLGLGVGKFISPNWAVDGELNYQNPNLSDNQNLNWSQYGVSLDFRRFWLAEAREYNPYLLFGVGYQRAEEEFDAFPNPDSPGQRENGNLAAKVGVGLQTTFDSRVAVRAEVAYRADFDDRSVNAPNEDWFGDVLASVGLVIPLGPPPVAPAPP
ncbi:porin family protein, partial [Pseudoxanthomonas koreensis]|uniref:porin family protein n=1 Tax=Pseudoxanthomonas koreensis TaxID=266061 RepID=UPI0013913912